MTAAHTRGLALFARAGYAARGLVYTLIGAFTVYAAWRGGGDAPGSKDAVRVILEAPAGDVLAIGLLAGLLGYAAWRFVQSVFDTDDHGAGVRGLAVRAGLLASCASYALLVLWTFSRWRGAGGDDGGGGVAETLAGFVGHRITAALLALVFAVVAFAHVRKAWVKGYARHFEADDGTMRWVHPVSRVGLCARGAVFAILAVSLGWRAWSAGGTGETPGLEDALAALRGLPAGAWLLGAMGLGLLCFALYSFVEARYRRINVEDA